MAVQTETEQGASAVLRGVLGFPGAVMLGLGSIIGTGVFVSLAIAAGIAGPAVIFAIVGAAVVASFNALSSAQLAAAHPVSGGTYEYGYVYLRPWLGFSAGWLFVCAKSASAATAALGCSAYLLSMIGMDADRGLQIGLAVAAVLLLTAVVLSGLHLSSRVNTAIVSLTLLALLAFVLAGLPTALRHGGERLLDFSGTQAAQDFWPALLQACALMFVAYTGYGRIATLGEEVREPRRTVPRAIMTALWISAGLYLATGLVALATLGAAQLGALKAGSAAPLVQASEQFGLPGLRWLLGAGAACAMLGVILNLLLGLSRVLMSMGRRGDMPPAFSRLNAMRTTPVLAVGIAGLLISCLALLGSVKTTWSFSAFTVLIYYAITNLCALNLPPESRLYPRWIAWAGLASCLLLAFWVDWPIWLCGLAVLLAGLLWHSATRRLYAQRGT